MGVTMRVWVVQYSHKHGTDVWVCATHEAVKRTVVQAIEEWLDDVDDEDVAERLRVLLLAGKREALIQAWRSYQDNPERFEWSENEVLE